MGSILWLLIVELSPVFHIVWAIPLSSATFWAFSLVQVMLFPLILQLPDIGLSVMSWTGSASAAMSYVVTLWLVPDLRKCTLGGMELHFKEVFNGDMRLNTFQASEDEIFNV